MSMSMYFVLGGFVPSMVSFFPRGVAPRWAHTEEKATT